MTTTTYKDHRNSKETPYHPDGFSTDATKIDRRVYSENNRETYIRIIHSPFWNPFLTPTLTGIEFIVDEEKILIEKARAVKSPKN